MRSRACGVRDRDKVAHLNAPFPLGCELGNHLTGGSCVTRVKILEREGWDPMLLSRNTGRPNFALCSRDSGGPMKFPAWSSFMRPSTLAVAATLAAFASDASAQGTRDYTGPLPPTNFRPLPSGTTPPTPNWQGYSTGYYRVIPQQRQIYPAPRTRSR